MKFTNFERTVLSILAEKAKMVRGYDLWTKAEERLEKDIAIGYFYEKMDELVAQGYVAKEARLPTPEQIVKRGNREVSYFQITGIGMKRRIALAIGEPVSDSTPQGVLQPA